MGLACTSLTQVSRSLLGAGVADMAGIPITNTIEHANKALIDASKSKPLRFALSRNRESPQPHFPDGTLAAMTVSRVRGRLGLSATAFHRRPQRAPGSGRDVAPAGAKLWAARLPATARPSVTRSNFRAHGEIFVNASLFESWFCWRGFRYRAAFSPERRDGKSSIPTVNQFSDDLGILKIRYF